MNCAEHIACIVPGLAATDQVTRRQLVVIYDILKPGVDRDHLAGLNRKGLAREIAAICWPHIEHDDAARFVAANEYVHGLLALSRQADKLLRAA